MAEQESGYLLRLAQGDDEPLVFYGPPNALRGSIRLQNQSDEKLKLRSIPLETDEIRGLTGAPLRHLDLAVRLYPGQQIDAPATLQIDPTTPPGTYRGNMQLGDRRQAVVVHVTQIIDLRVEPTSVSFYTQGEFSFTQDFVIENAGNVPLRIGPKCLAPLVDSMEVPLGIRRSLLKACQSEDKDTLRALLCALAGEQVGNLELTREDITLAPGEKRAAAGTFNLPSNLQSYRRYDADLALYNATLHVEVYTGEMPKKTDDKPPRGGNKE